MCADGENFSSAVRRVPSAAATASDAGRFSFDGGVGQEIVCVGGPGAMGAASSLSAVDVTGGADDQDAIVRDVLRAGLESQTGIPGGVVGGLVRLGVIKRDGSWDGPRLQQALARVEGVSECALGSAHALSSLCQGSPDSANRRVPVPANGNERANDSALRRSEATSLGRVDNGPPAAGKPSPTKLHLSPSDFNPGTVPGLARFVLERVIMDLAFPDCKLNDIVQQYINVHGPGVRFIMGHLKSLGVVEDGDASTGACWNKARFIAALRQLPPVPAKFKGAAESCFASLSPMTPTASSVANGAAPKTKHATTTSSLGNVLGSAGLTHLEEAFITAGYTKAEAVAGLTTRELKTIGVANSQVPRLRAALSETVAKPSPAETPTTPTRDAVHELVPPAVNASSGPLLDDVLRSADLESLSGTLARSGHTNAELVTTSTNLEFKAMGITKCQRK